MSNAFLQSCQTEPAICPNPIFIIGAPRSGTTVLARALSQHSHFWASDESFIMFDLFGSGRLQTVFERWTARPCSSWLRTENVERDEFLAFVGLGMNALFTSRSQGKRWIDHTPHHALMADVLAGMFPGALFMHIIRDGRRVVNSMINVDRTLTASELEQMQKGNFLPRWGTDFREACRTWRQHTDAAMETCASRPEHSLTVSHGQLERDPRGVLRHILEFLQAPYEDAPADYLNSHRINSSFAKRQDRGALPDARPNSWSEWTGEQRQIFAEEAGDALVHYGFASPEELTLSEYEIIVLRTQQLGLAKLPVGAKVIVVSKGDPQLIELPGRQASHFPQDETGEYAGGNPADSAQAVTQLERAREQGAEFLMLPKTAFWWLEHYHEFCDYLRSSCHLAWRNDDCIIYDLNRNAGRMASEQELLSPSRRAAELDVPAMRRAHEDHKDNQKLLAMFLSEKPKLHYWNGDWRYGGLSDAMLRKLFEIACSINDSQAILLETGAGLSTLVLLMAQPKKLISIAPDKALKQRIDTQIERYFLDNAEHDYYLNRSENVLPELARCDHPFVDLALIDGGHEMATVFVDFFYINTILKQGGHLAIDDLQLHAPRQLYLLLQRHRDFEVFATIGKFAIFRKLERYGVPSD